jgi:hypothetical protein
MGEGASMLLLACIGMQSDCMEKSGFWTKKKKIILVLDVGLQISSFLDLMVLISTTKKIKATAVYFV